VFVPLLIMLFVVVTTPMTLAHDRKRGQALEDAARRGLVGLIIVLMVLKPF